MLLLEFERKAENQVKETLKRSPLPLKLCYRNAQVQIKVTMLKMLILLPVDYHGRVAGLLSVNTQL